jgi:hypothetical protein
MSSNAAEASPTGHNAESGSGSGTRGGQQRRDRDRNDRNRRSGGKRETKFEGKCADLKASVYDVLSGKDTFAKTTREIAEYVGREYDDAGEFRTGMVELRLPPLVRPAAPPDNSLINVELWKIEIGDYQKQVVARRRNSAKVYSLILGQCSQALRNRLEASTTWAAINDGSDVIRLLQLVQTCMMQRQTRQYPLHSLWDAENHVFKFQQRNLANNEYYDKFKDLVANAERLGSDMGAHSARVEAILQEVAVDPDMPTAAETTQARERAKDEFLAVMFIMNCDRRRYGTLVRDIENEFTRGTNTYPTTLNTAYDYIVNFRGDGQGGSNPDEGVAFYTDDNNEASGRDGGRGGRGAGRGGRGGGRTGNRSGRGGSRNNTDGGGSSASDRDNTGAQERTHHQDA